ncbi:hypothetical protein [Mesorhizobium sp. M0322]
MPCNRPVISPRDTRCDAAVAGLFETLLDEEDAVMSDALNHTSIIDGVRL